MQLLVVLNPVTSLLLHLLHDLVTFVTDQILFDDFSGGLKVVHELHASLSSLFLSLSHALEWVTDLLLHGHGTTSHT